MVNRKKQIRLQKTKTILKPLSGQSAKKPPKLKSALLVQNLRGFLAKLSIDSLLQIYSSARMTNYWWVEDPTVEKIKLLQQSIPHFNEIFKVQILLDRLKILNLFPRPQFIGVHISAFFPELILLIKTSRDIVEELPAPGLEKAEAWLKSVASDLSHDPDLEAAVYLASRGFKNLVDSTEIEKHWHSEVCYSIKSGRPVGRVPKEIQKLAALGQLSLRQAVELLKFNGHLFSFWGYRDEEEDYVAATMLRTAEWFSIGGFDEWWKSIASDLSTGPQNGIEHGAAGRVLFYWCRSDLALQITDRHGIESWLWVLSNGAHVREQPWRIFYAARENPRLRDYLQIAACLVFAWQRIRPARFQETILNASIKLLMETQLRSGGWPVYSDETDPCLLTTCYAVHALALARPLGWERKVRAASDWLWSQQNPFGYWIIEGGPTVMLTVLVLDAIALAKGLPTTFGADTDPTSISGNDNLHEQIQASVCVLEGAENQGTGFFIKEFGLITCNHVYREDLKVFTYTKPEEKSPVTRVVCDKNIDLAVLKTQFKPKHYLEADFREPKDGEHVLLCGFPKYAPGSTVVKAEAQITGSRMYFGNRRYLLDKPIVVGNSGGPVIDMRGKVIGVAATGTNDRSDGNPDEQFGVIPVVLLRQLLALNERK